MRGTSVPAASDLITTMLHQKQESHQKTREEVTS
jgi:hypothetical protein